MKAFQDLPFAGESLASGTFVSEEIIQALHHTVNLSKKRSWTLSAPSAIQAKRNYCASSDKNRKWFDPDRRSAAVQQKHLNIGEHCRWSLLLALFC